MLMPVPSGNYGVCSLHGGHLGPTCPVCVSDPTIFTGDAQPAVNVESRCNLLETRIELLEALVKQLLDERPRND